MIEDSIVAEVRRVRDELAAKFNYDLDATVRDIHDQQAARLASAWRRAEEVLGTHEAAQRWLSTAQKALGGVTPFEFCRTDADACEIAGLLGRLEHGVLS